MSSVTCGQLFKIHRITPARSNLMWNATMAENRVIQNGKEM